MKSRKSAEANPLSLLDSVHPEDREYVVQQFHKIMNGEAGKDIEFRIQFPDKSVKWLCVNAALNEKESAECVITGGAEDVTAIKGKTAFLKRSMAKKGSVLSILVHDLAGPLKNINGICYLIKEELKEYNNPELDKMIGMVTKTSERSMHLIKEFVTQDFLESTSVEVTKKRTDIVAELREVIKQYKSFEEFAGSKTFNLHSSNDKVYVKIDAYKFMQVINNLISNAVKFTHEGGVINLYVEEKEEDVLIIVADNGVGIPASLQGVLFEKFTKARREGLKGEPTIGLGMSIVKTIVEWHNGRIWFESKEKKGTTFYIEIPKE